MVLRYFYRKMSLIALDWCLGEDQLSVQDPHTAHLSSQPWTKSCHFETEGCFIPIGH